MASAITPTLVQSQVNRQLKHKLLLSTTNPSEWQTVLRRQCSFPPEIFGMVMLNLIRNPNITSSHLFRADVYFDRELTHDHDEAEFNKSVQQLKDVFRPRPVSIPDWTLERTVVRELMPRNTQLDKHLVQTCHFLVRQQEIEEHMVIYIPHVDAPENMPFYHPKVAELSFRHEWRSSDASPAKGAITLSYRLFDGTVLDERLQRTGLKLLETIVKHGQGHLAGYEKRVHHDRIIPQKVYQDTYTRLKNKYGRHLSDNWVEVTDPGKHVFEDIGIAAFLIELWSVMYKDPSNEYDDRPVFPGFVDIGCGNGVLTYLLISEGYKGYGFDARQRKTWSTFPEKVQACLQQQLLVPDIFLPQTVKQEDYHNGVFDAGTFIVSNHADELTAWTPLLAYLNEGSFIAIPCCSHNLAGARFRASSTVKSRGGKHSEARLPQQEQNKDLIGSYAAETGSLKRTLVQKKMASAYSTLCDYVESIAGAVGYEAEEEVLRIPSTRNHSIIGRTRSKQGSTREERKTVVGKLVEEELGQDLQAIALEWVERAEKLAKKPSSGH